MSRGALLQFGGLAHHCSSHGSPRLWHLVHCHPRLIFTHHVYCPHGVPPVVAHVALAHLLRLLQYAHRGRPPLEKRPSHRLVLGRLLFLLFGGFGGRLFLVAWYRLFITDITQLVGYPGTYE